MPVRRSEGAAEEACGEDFRGVTAADRGGGERREAGDQLERRARRGLAEQSRDGVDPVLAERALGHRQVLGSAALAERQEREGGEDCGWNGPAGEDTDPSRGQYREGEDERHLWLQDDE